jgi:hypothetical protein
MDRKIHFPIFVNRNFGVATRQVPITLNWLANFDFPNAHSRAFAAPLDRSRPLELQAGTFRAKRLAEGSRDPDDADGLRTRIRIDVLENE